MGFADEFVADLKACGAPEDPDPRVLRDLVEQYRHSPPSGPGYPRDPVRDAIILQLAFPVYRLTLRYRGRNNADDVLGEALLTLVQCVENWWSVAADDNIRRYVEYSVNRRMKDFVDNDAVIVMPSRRVREKVANGEPVEPIHAFAFDHDDEEERDSPRIPPDDSLDTMEFFGGEPGAAIAQLRLAGLPIVEIAATVGLSPKSVYRHLHGMEQAYDDALRPPTPVEDGEILALRRMGLSPKQIGRRLGKSTAAVKKRLKLLEGEA